MKFLIIYLLLLIGGAIMGFFCCALMAGRKIFELQARIEYLECKKGGENEHGPEISGDTKHES